MNGLGEITSCGVIPKDIIIAGKCTGGIIAIAAVIIVAVIDSGEFIPCIVLELTIAVDVAPAGGADGIGDGDDGVITIVILNVSVTLFL